MPLFAAMIALSTVPATELKRSPKVGDRFVYALKATIGKLGSDNARFTGTISEEVKSVASGAINWKVDSRIEVDVLGIVHARPVITTTKVETLEGVLTEAKNPEPAMLFGGLRLDRLRAVFLPATSKEVGDGWWRIENGNPKDGLPPFSAYTKWDGEETVDGVTTWKFTTDVREVDAAETTRVRGQIYLEKSSGALVWGQWLMEGFPTGKDSPPADARIELKRRA